MQTPSLGVNKLEKILYEMSAKIWVVLPSERQVGKEKVDGVPGVGYRGRSAYKTFQVMQYRLETGE